jgi:serine phosphatase RsbU (regulator of sigma subunit)
MIEINSQKLNSLLESAYILNSNLDLQQLLPLIMLKSKELLDAKASSLFLLDEDEKFLYCETAIGEGGESIQKYLRLEIGDGIAGWVAKHQEPAIIKNAYNDPRFDPSWDQQSGFKTMSVICVPLFMRLQLIGTLQVFNKNNGQEFEDIDFQVLVHLANISAVAIYNTQLRDTLRRRVLELSMLSEFEKELSAIYDLAKISNWLLDKCLQVIESKTGSLLIWDRNEQVLKIIASRGIDSETVKEVKIALGEGISGYVAKEKKPILVHDIEQDERFKKSNMQKYETKSFISAPIIYQNDLLGLININNKNSGFIFTKSDLKLLNTLAYRLGIAIKNSQLSDKIIKTEEKLKQAKRIMQQIITKEVPIHPELNINVKYILMDKIGGDFYKFFHFPDGKIAILIADICGHGLSAAMLASVAHSVISTLNEELLHTPGRLLTQMNEVLSGLMGGNFLTAYYCIIDFEQDTLIYANGGHPHPFLFQNKHLEITSLKSQGSIIGVIPGMIYEESQIRFSKGDKLFIFTDGLLESTNKDRYEYLDDDKVSRLVLRNIDRNGDLLIEEILNGINKELSRKEFMDDVTFIIVERKS